MRPIRIALLLAGFLAFLPSPGRAAEPADKPPGSWRDPYRYIDGAYQASVGAARRVQHIEAVEMVAAILGGSQLGPGEGWFHAGQSRYDWKWLAARYDADHDGVITRKEFTGPADLFGRLDRNRDGVLTPDDFDWSERSPFLRETSTARMVFGRIDRDTNGHISREEWEAFFKKAAKGKDHLTPEDVREALFPPAPPRNGAAGGGGPSPLLLLHGLFVGEIGSIHEGPGLNQKAPDFTLKTEDGKQEIALSQFRGKKPVVLVFGNFSCGPFRSHTGTIEDLHHRYGDRVQFVAVYVREAHPTDGWRMAFNDQAGIAYRQPRDKAERDQVAHRACTALELTMPLLVDDMDDAVGHAYSAMPARLYVIDRAGKVAYKSGRGPFGLKPGEMEQALDMLLLDEAGPAKPAPARVPALKDEEAWKKLPPLTEGKQEPLPAWARMLATALPRTTAAMLELDYIHREHSPLDPKLRGKLRWVAAHANLCAYAEAYAVADLRRAGLDAAGLEVLQGDHAKLPDKERAVLTFARKLTLAADTVTDEEVAQLIKLYGEKEVVGILLLLAHANFQDRLFLTLGVQVEESGPLKPLAGRFAKAGDYKAPPRTVPAETAPAPLKAADAPTWSPLDFEQLQQHMETQRERKPRIAVPSWDEVSKRLPTAPAKPLRIKWSLVCLGYQQEMALGWSACTRAFEEEAAQDRVFEESLFWVVTRSLDCFY